MSNSQLYSSKGFSYSEDTNDTVPRIKCDADCCVDDAINKADGIALCAKHLIEAKQDNDFYNEPTTITQL